MSKPKVSGPTDSMRADDGGFAARLRAAREERDFAQSTIAHRSKVIDPEGRGVSRTAVIAYEQGTSRPGLRELRLLCEVLHVTPNWLVYGTDSASRAALPAFEFIDFSKSDLAAVFTLALALLSLKGHERDSLLTLALSLAGRKLGDRGLSALMAWGPMLRDAFMEVLQRDFPAEVATMALEELAEYLASEGLTTNMGNRFRLDLEEGRVLNPDVAVYPEPSKPSR